MLIAPYSMISLSHLSSIICSTYAGSIPKIEPYIEVMYEACVCVCVCGGRKEKSFIDIKWFIIAQ